VGEGRPRLGGLPSAGSNFILVTLAAVISDGPVLLRAPASCYEEWVHSGNEDAHEELIAPDCPLFFGGMFMGTGPEAFKQTSTITYPAFPASGGPSTRSSPRGHRRRAPHRARHARGGVHGCAPTGSRVEIPAMAMARFRGGKIAEMRGMPNMLGLLQQIGGVPAPGSPETAAHSRPG